MDNWQIHIAGENALIVYFTDPDNREVDNALAARVQQGSDAIRNGLGDYLVDTVPSYGSTLVVFDALRADHIFIRRRIREALQSVDSVTDTGGRLIELPAWYDESVGPDLPQIATRAGISVNDVIDIHSSTEYRVYAIGFAPGFAYLGQVDERIAAPRLATPRKRVPRGAVAVADRQTAVYPSVSPGGWNLLGLCPQRMFDPEAEPTMPVAAGDRVRFKAIDRAQFLDMGGVMPEGAIE